MALFRSLLGLLTSLKYKNFDFEHPFGWIGINVALNFGENNSCLLASVYFFE